MDRCPSPTQEGFGSHRWHFEPTSAFYLFGDSPYFGSIMTGNSVASEKYWAMAQIGDRSKKRKCEPRPDAFRIPRVTKNSRNFDSENCRSSGETAPYTGLHVDFDPEAAWLTLASKAWGKEGNPPPLLRWDICQNPPAPSIGPKNPDWRRLEAGSCKMRHRANLLPRLFARTRSDSCVICRWFTTICFKHYHLWQKQSDTWPTMTLLGRISFNAENGKS